jgi:hypothetical protein
MRFSTPVKIILACALLLVAWNAWLPSAWDMYSTVSQTDSGPLHNVDFWAYYNGGARFADGENPYFWGNDAQGEPVISDYIYPPTALPLFSLLSLMPYDVARLLWAALYGLSFLAILAWLARSFAPDWREAFLTLAIFLTLVSYPLLSHILHGQVDVFIISLILACYLCYVREKRLPAAILLAVATLVKVSPAFLLIYFVLFQRDLRFLWMYAAALAALAGLSLLAVPAGLYVDYVRYVLPDVSKSTSFWLNQSIPKYLTFSPWLARGVSVGGLGVLAGLIWAIGRRIPAGQRRPVLPLGGDGFPGEAVFILNLAGILIFLGKAWTAAYVWLILPSAWLLVGLSARRARAAVVAVAAAGVLLAMSKVYGFPFLNSMNLWGGLLLTVSLTVGLLTGKLVPPPPPAAVKKGPRR